MRDDLLPRQGRPEAAQAAGQEREVHLPRLRARRGEREEPLLAEEALTRPGTGVQRPQRTPRCAVGRARWDDAPR
ncbi:MAG: hypothetical protein MZW92_24810 [Comamonadaceae bacterium]|nr:hypothetical protein [Comamonadaceae bacterium]